MQFPPVSRHHRKGEVETVGPVREYKTDDIKKTIDEFPKHRLISFSGGETLVRKDFPEIIRYASRKHHTHIVTNAVLINEKIAQIYVDLAPRYFWKNGLVLIGISMEGDEALHDAVVQRPVSWKKTVERVRHLVRLRKQSGKQYPWLNLKMAVTKDTVHGMVDFMRLARDFGVDLVNFLTAQDLIGHSATLSPLAGPAPGLTDPQNPSRQGLIPKLGHIPASPGQMRGVDGRYSRLPGPSPVGPSDPNDTSRFIQAPLHRARLPGSSRLRRASEGNGFCNSDDGSEVLRVRGCGEPGFTPR